MKFSVFQLSRIGGRQENEDRMGYCYTRESGLFVLADGMGGHPQGEVAAQIAIETICSLYQKAAAMALLDAGQFLSNALLAAHQQIVRHAIQKGMLDSPRTTLVAAVLQDATATWVHCGDSRLYVVRNRRLLIRTRDHSYLEQQNAVVNKSQPANRNILFSCLGSSGKPIFEISEPVKLVQGDRLLLCSDGLWGSLDDAEIVQRLAGKPVSEAVPDLVESALRTAGEYSDNVTALAVEWETPDAFESTRGVLSDSLLDGEFLSTIQPSFLDPLTGELDELDDASIERSIAEINAAIRRSAARKA